MSKEYDFSAFEDEAETKESEFDFSDFENVEEDVDLSQYIERPQTMATDETRARALTGAATTTGLEALERAVGLGVETGLGFGELTPQNLEDIKQNIDRYEEIVKMTPGDTSAYKGTQDLLDPVVDELQTQKRATTLGKEALEQAQTKMSTDEMFKTLTGIAEETGQVPKDASRITGKAAPNPLDKLRQKAAIDTLKSEAITPSMVEGQAMDKLGRKEAVTDFIDQLVGNDPKKFDEMLYNADADAFAKVDPDTKKVLLEKVKPIIERNFGDPVIDPDTGIASITDQTTGKTFTEPTKGKFSPIEISPSFKLSDEVQSQVLKELDYLKGIEDPTGERLYDYITRIRDKGKAAVASGNKELADVYKEFDRQLSAQLPDEFQKFKSISAEGFAEESPLKKLFGTTKGEDIAPEFKGQQKLTQSSYGQLDKLANPQKNPDAQNMIDFLQRRGATGQEALDELNLRSIRSTVKGGSIPSGGAIVAAGETAPEAIKSQARGATAILPKIGSEVQERGTRVGAKGLGRFLKGASRVGKLAGLGATGVGLLAEGFDATVAGAPTIDVVGLAYKDEPEQVRQLGQDLTKADPMELMTTAGRLRMLGDSNQDTIYGKKQGQDAMIRYAEQLEEAAGEDFEKRAKTMFGLSQDPAFRKSLRRLYADDSKKKANNSTERIIEDRVSREDSARQRDTGIKRFISKEIIDQHEQGYQRDRTDRGNYIDGRLVGTKYGISAPVLQNYLGRKVTSKDMRNLKKKTAEDILYNQFYKEGNIDSLDKDKQKAVLDFYMNSGPTAIKVLQRKAGVPTDGIIGPQTKKAINNLTLDEIADARIDMVKKSGKINRKWKKGIIKRANQYRK